MTTKPPTRKELEAERAGLINLMCRLDDGDTVHEAVLNASIARVEALLSLSDEDCQYLSDELLPTAPPAFHVVAALVRRTPS